MQKDNQRRPAHHGASCAGEAYHLAAGVGELAGRCLWVLTTHSHLESRLDRLPGLVVLQDFAVLASQLRALGRQLEDPIHRIAQVRARHSMQLDLAH